MGFEFDVQDVQQQAEKFLYSLDFAPIENISVLFDDKKHRYRILGDKPSETSAYYCFYSDGLPAGYALSFRSGECVKWHYEPPDKKDDKEYQKAVKKMFKDYEANAAKRAEEIALEQKAKSQEAEQVFLNANANNQPYEIDTPYLKNKSIDADFLRVDGQMNLLVPIRNIDGHFMTVQFISPDGNKKFYPGAPVTGGFFYANNERNEEAASNIFSNDIFDNPEIPLLICEGVATAKSLLQITDKKFPVIAAMNCHNILKVAGDCRDKFPYRKIFIMADNDRQTENKTGKNPGIDAAKKAIENGYANAYMFPHFPPRSEMNPDESGGSYDNRIGLGNKSEQEALRLEDIWDKGTDWNDFLQVFDIEKTKNELREQFCFANSTDAEKAAIQKTHIINAEDLRKKEIPPIKWAVEGMLPEGLTILAGSPKIGKSILALHLALAVAIGGVAFGKISVIQGAVLYLALEDTERRLQTRILDAGIDLTTSLSLLSLVTQIPKQHEGGIQYLEWWLRSHTNARLVIIDTLQIFRIPISGKKDRYAEDYDALTEIKRLADKYKVAIMVVHHLKKGGDSDWTQEISGTNGIAGSADCILAIKRERTQSAAILHRTGRDVEEKDFKMILERFNWILLGEAEEMTMPKWKRDIIDYIKENGKCTPMELAVHLNIDPNTAKQNLFRLVKEGLIIKLTRGVYAFNDKENKVNEG